MKLHRDGVVVTVGDGHPFAQPGSGWTPVKPPVESKAEPKRVASTSKK